MIVLAIVYLVYLISYLIHNSRYYILMTRMAVAFGKVNTFNLSQDDWPLYVERLEHVFVANGITDRAKK